MTQTPAVTVTLPATEAKPAQAHTDHFGGAGGVITAADASSGRIQVIVPKGFVEEVTSGTVTAGTAMGRRAFYQFAYFLPVGPKGPVRGGMNGRIAQGNESFIPPNRLIKRAGKSITIDGFELVFQMVPGSEAPAELNLYIPSKRALLIAEIATGPLHQLQTRRGAKVRDGERWAHYLTELQRLLGRQKPMF